MYNHRFARGQHPLSHAGFSDEMKRAFDQLLQGAFHQADGESKIVTAQWTPHVDIREEADRFVILADVPGVDPKDIEIQMDKGTLSIKGERKADAAKESDRPSRLERVHGAFYRRFALPDSAHADGIVASGANGVLEIVIPKKPETTPRRIQVN